MLTLRPASAMSHGQFISIDQLTWRPNSIFDYFKGDKKMKSKINIKRIGRSALSYILAIMLIVSSTAAPSFAVGIGGIGLEDSYIEGSGDGGPEGLDLDGTGRDDPIDGEQGAESLGSEDPDLEGPGEEDLDLEDPGEEDPDLDNPDLEDPDIDDPDIGDPDLDDSDLEDPDLDDPSIKDPEIGDPDLEDPDLDDIDLDDPDLDDPDLDGQDPDELGTEGLEVEEEEEAGQAGIVGSVSFDFDNPLKLETFELTLGISPSQLLLTFVYF